MDTNPTAVVNPGWLEPVGDLVCSGALERGSKYSCGAAERFLPRRRKASVESVVAFGSPQFGKMERYQQMT